MLKYGNLEFRNLQEQVEENMKDIQDLKQGVVVLDEFGIKVIGEVASVDDMPTVEEYKEEHENWEYGDSYAVGTEPPYTMYILTRGNNENPDDYWFNIGIFPMPGPQGEQGIQGETGPQGQTGETGPAGVDAGFGTPTASVTQYSRGTQPSVSVEASGSNTEKVFSFAFGIPSGAPSVTLTGTSGTLTLTQLTMLLDQPDSIILYRAGSGAAIVYWTLQRWYKSEDYLYFISFYSYSPYKTVARKCTIDLSNRNYTIADDEIKINSSNISSYNTSTSSNVTQGKVLTADGNGGASWEDLGGSGLEVVTLTQSTSTLSDDDYNKLNGDNAIIKFVSSADGWTKYFKKYKDDGTYIYYYQVSQEDGSGTFFGGFRIVKSTKYCASLNSYLTVTSSNIKSGSTIANQYLTSNGSGGTSWTSGPSQVQSDWNESSQSSPAYIKNKPTIPTIPVTDVTVNGTSVMDGTVAKVLVDTVDGATDGTNWTSLTVNGTTAAIPAAQVNSDWNAVSGVAQILNKPTIPTKVSDLQNDSGYITGITSSDVTTALGYTPYNSSNPNGYTSNVGTVTSVNNVSPVNGDVTIAIPPTITITTTSGSESVSDGTNTLSFGSNAFNSTSIPSVSGTNDGTNWTTLTINSVTKNIPAGGSGSGVSDVTIDGTSIVSNNVAAMTTETWTFTLSDNTTVTKKVVLG